MIKLSKTDLNDVLEIFFLANTPRSLLRGMTRTSAIQNLRRCSSRELLEYYDRLTARAERSELIVALTYAVLCAILLRIQEGDRVDVDAARLLWGEQIRSYFERSIIPSGQITVGSEPPKTNVISSAPAPSKLPTGLLGPDGQPLGAWRNS